MRSPLDWLAALHGRFVEWAGMRAGLVAALYNTGWLFADKAMRMAVGVLVGAWMAGYLAPEQFGQTAYVLSFVAFFSVVALSGALHVVPLALCASIGPAMTRLREQDLAAYHAALVRLFALMCGKPARADRTPE